MNTITRSHHPTTNTTTITVLPLEVEIGGIIKNIHDICSSEVLLLVVLPRITTMDHHHHSHLEATIATIFKSPTTVTLDLGNTTRNNQETFCMVMAAVTVITTTLTTTSTTTRMMDTYGSNHRHTVTTFLRTLNFLLHQQILD